MILNKQLHLPEYYELKHRWDDNKNKINKEDNILKKTLSPYLFKNDTMNEFLLNLQPLVWILFDNVNIIKNFKNYKIDKYSE